MDRYAFAYRVGFTPWERHATATRASTRGDSGPGGGRTVAAVRSGDRPRVMPGPLHLRTRKQGWQAVGIDLVPLAITAASRRGDSGASFVVADVTNLASADLGTFDFFLDIGCFQGMSPEQQLAEGRGVSALANPGATLLVLAFQPTRIRTATGAASRTDIETAFPGWEMLSVEPANTAGLGWPLTRTAPQWFRLRLMASA